MMYQYYTQPQTIMLKHLETLLYFVQFYDLTQLGSLRFLTQTHEYELGVIHCSQNLSFLYHSHYFLDVKLIIKQ